MNIKKNRLKEFIEKGLENKRPYCLGVVWPTEVETIRGVLMAAEEGFVEPVFIGSLPKMRQAIIELKEDFSKYRLIAAKDCQGALDKAIQMVKENKIHGLKKGDLHTGAFMHAIVSSSANLRTNRRMSHCFVLDIPSYHKPMLITDCTINIAPDLKTKRDIIQNVIDLAHNLKIAEPKVALLSASEEVMKSILSTVDADILCKAANNGGITGGKLEGPLSFDIAISKEIAEIKKINSAIAGDVDVFMVPNIEVGNVLYKALNYLACGVNAGIVLGVKIPVVLTSRGANANERALSCALAGIMHHNNCDLAKYN